MESRNNLRLNESHKSTTVGGQLQRMASALCLILLSCLILSCRGIGGKTDSYPSSLGNSHSLTYKTCLPNINSGLNTSSNSQNSGKKNDPPIGRGLLICFIAVIIGFVCQGYGLRITGGGTFDTIVLIFGVLFPFLVLWFWIMSMGTFYVWGN